MPTLTKTEDVARARIALANATKRQQRHERHRKRAGVCPWCAGADRALEEARAEVARLERC
jgi:hypothetical protein